MAFRDLNGSVDFEYLEGYLGRDAVLVDEVLGIFVQQSDLWSPLLDSLHEGWRDAAHTLKGAALGIGARGLADLASAAEVGDQAGAHDRLERVKTALSAVLLDIAAYRHGQALKSLQS